MSVENSIIVAVSEISLMRSSKSTDIDVPKSTDTDLATDMSGHGVASVPEVEINDSGVTSTLRISLYVHRVGGAIQLQVYRVAGRYILSLIHISEPTRPY